MDDYILVSRTLIAVGLTLLMAMLRLDSERFGTAEYYEVSGSRNALWVRRRLAWYGIGLGLAIGLFLIHSAPQRQLFLGVGHLLGSVVGGIAFGAVGVLTVAGLATYRHQRIRPPDERSYPEALLNASATAFIDEVAFRGAMFGLLLSAGVDPLLANLLQTIFYTLTTRLGAPGRDRSLLVMTLGIGLVGGWLTSLTGGIAAAFVGHAVTRFALFLCGGPVGQTLPRGREGAELAGGRRTPEGWRLIGSRESTSRNK